MTATRAPQADGPRPAVKRRQHPARTARAVALVSSVAATFGVGAGLARADRAGVATAAAGGTSRATGTGASGAGSSTSTGSAATGSAATGSTSTAGRSGSTSTAGRSTATPGSTYQDGTYTGSLASMRWGQVQVRATIKGGKIVSVDEIVSPSDRKSVVINDRAQPVLESEAVAAQSADIHAVSGATYTSVAYATSLQGALDKAAKAAPVTS